MKDTALILLAAATVAAAVTSPTLDVAGGAAMVAGQWEPNDGGVAMKVVCPVASYSLPNGGNQTYSFVVNESPDGSTWTAASPVRTVAGDGVPPTGGVLNLGFFSRKRYLQLVVTPAGTSPSIVLGDCYLTPIVDSFGA